MNELQKNSERWRGLCLKIAICIALSITTVEIVMSFSLHFQNLILQETLMEYISQYFILPNVIIWGGMILLALVFFIVNRNKEALQSKNDSRYECGSLYDDILNSTLMFMITLSVGTAAYVHYIFRVTVAGFCIPIFLCIVFYSRKICIQTLISSEIMLVFVAIHRYSRSVISIESDPYLYEDIIIIMFFVLVIGIIALHICRHMREQFEQTIEARKAAEVANQAKSTFLANMSHEIRTPINAVMGMDEMILRTSFNEEILSYALDIKNASNSLLSIINEILDVSKIESGKMEILPVKYDLSNLVHDVYNTVAIRAKDKGLDLLLDVDEDLPNHLIGDDLRIHQIITNLLSNGVKYTIRGSVTLKICGTRTDDGIILHVMVKDTGIGIKEEDMPHLIEKFQRVDRHQNRKVEGTGLGMSIAVSFLEMMNSSLRIESEYGVGSCFSFDLFQEIEKDEPVGNLVERFGEASRNYQHKQQSAWIAPKAKILVVDDNSMNIKVFKGLTKQSMMRINEAVTGEECIEMASQMKYDIIFLDDMMPGMDGIETLRALRENHESLCKTTPIIAFTANAVKGAMETYIANGFDGYLAKPVDSEKLDKLILDMLDSELVEYGSENTSQTQYSDGGTMTLPEIMGIDWRYGLSVWGHKELLLELSSDFYEDLPNVMEKLAGWEEKLEEDNNISSFTIRVHALKGSAATIGALPLSSMARLLEKAAREKDYEKVHVLWPYLRELMEEYRENMEILA